MSDTEVNPPLRRTGTAPSAKSGGTGSDQDDAIDAALDAAAGRGLAGWEAGASDLPFKRQWDAGLQAELEAALTGFDPATFEVASSRSRSQDRPLVADRDRGQESCSGSAPVRSSCVRGKSVFC